MGGFVISALNFHTFAMIVVRRKFAMIVGANTAWNARHTFVMGSKKTL
jgi:hypothetical protein